MTAVLLHGFWGQPRDWSEVLQRLPLQQAVIAPDLYEDPALSPDTKLMDWPKRFWQWVDHHIGEQQIIIVGYSMGSRLAMHAIAYAPERVARALLVSGQVQVPGESHAERLAWEQDWAEKFQNEDWQSLQASWQEQSVFAASKPQERRESDALRSALGASLINWSPRNHLVDWKKVREFSPKIEWAFGALDQNYRPVANSLQELPVQGQITIIPNVGHRVIHESPEVIGDWIQGRNLRSEV